MNSGSEQWAFKKLYGSSATSFINLFKEKLEKLFDEYASIRAMAKTKESSSRSAKVNNTSDTYMADFDDYSNRESNTSTDTELDLYLKENILPRSDDLNVLEYWKTLQGRYPVVSQMARDILSIPISTVASESVFSIGGKVLDAYRSSLKPQTAEELVCLRDWVFKDASLEPEVEALCKQTLALKVDNDDHENETTPNPSSQTQQSVG